MQVTDHSVRFKAASLNAWNSDWAIENYGSWKEALDFLMSWGRQHDPDIFCVQQLPSDHFDDISRVLSMRRSGVLRSRLEGQNDGCLVLWNPMSFRSGLKQTIWFSESPCMPGSKLFSKFEPRAAQAAVLWNEHISLRVVCCQWEPISAVGEVELLSDTARIFSANLIRKLLDKGIEDDPDLRRFSEETRGMPSLICGGFEERPGLESGRHLLEQASFRPAINMEFAKDDIYASPSIKLVEVLDTGGLIGQRPLLVELELMNKQDDGVEVSIDPVPSDEERHSWPKSLEPNQPDARTPERSAAGIK